jgi:hypothetical protein
MTVPFKRRRVVVRSVGRNGASLAVYCARNVYDAVDRRSPEAWGLAGWLEGNGSELGLHPGVRALLQGRPAG